MKSRAEGKRKAQWFQNPPPPALGILKCQEYPMKLCSCSRLYRLSDLLFPGATVKYLLMPAGWRARKSCHLQVTSEEMLMLQQTAVALNTECNGRWTV